MAIQCEATEHVARYPGPSTPVAFTRKPIIVSGVRFTIVVFAPGVAG